MYKLFIILMVTALFSCSDNKTTVTTAPAADTLMDSTTIKMKADTTKKRIDNLDDSIKNLREKAAENAN